MEIICRILQQHPLSSTEYTDRQGQQKTFNAIGFELVPAVKTTRQDIKTTRQFVLSKSSCCLVVLKNLLVVLLSSNRLVVLLSSKSSCCPKTFL